MGWHGPMTHRQYAAWQEWLGMQWNHPSRTDYYLMQLTQALYAVNGVKSGSLSKLKIPFGSLSQKSSDAPAFVMTEAQKNKMAKSSKFAAIGIDLEGNPLGHRKPGKRPSKK